MTTLRLSVDPDVRLRSYCTDVPADRVQDVLAMATLMFEAMEEWDGVGLAANQVGLTDRLFVYDDREGHQGLLINPEIADASGTSTDSEGCLSIPGQRLIVPRAAEVAIQGVDADGPATVEASGLLARILQHEIDHLNGVLITRQAGRAGGAW